MLAVLAGFGRKSLPADSRPHSQVEVAVMQRNHSLTILAVIAVFAVALAFAPEVWAATETVLYSFQGGADGAYANGGVIEVNGRLYGTTVYGGTYNEGTVYELRHTKAGWTKKTLHNFSFHGNYGGEPQAGLVADRAGNLYGVCFVAAYGGAVFKLSPGPKGRWRFTVIHLFIENEGSGPYGGLVIDDSGNLYGTTVAGGTNECFGHGCGTVFELSPSGGGWVLTTLHDFDGVDGLGPMSTLYRDDRGSLYGNTETGGLGSYCGGMACGVVFELSRSGDGWKFADLYSFDYNSAGGNPIGPMVMDREGNLYGTNQDDGTGGYGVVYKLTPHDGIWQFDVLYSFRRGSDGMSPTGGVVLDSKGNLYGPTLDGGDYDFGTVFKVRDAGKAWKESVVFSFDGSDGNNPQYGLTWGADGELIGATEVGGSGRAAGAIFAIRP
jgi:uncharacterized repeat protein (TIGR03803 family)